MARDSQSLVRMYECVLDKERHNLSEEEVSRAIKAIVKAYKKIHSDAPITAVDYNDRAYRFAYVYLYALCHTATVREILNVLRKNSLQTFREMLKLNEGRLSVCNLGGGPGCEIVGILSGIGRRDAPSNVECTVLDTCYGWRYTLGYVMKEFVRSEPGTCYKSKLNYQFVESDLCNSLSYDAVVAIRDADLVTMIKFVSVVSFYYRDNSDYLKRIFDLMKPGSYLLFLDNSTGGFFEMVSEVAQESDLILVFQHKTFHKQDPKLRFTKYKYSTRSLQSSSVIFAVWKKREKRELRMCVCL